MCADITRWQYTGVEGGLVFVADKVRGGLCFRVVDLASGLGVVWDHELPKELEYNQDKPFFHTWQADVGPSRVHRSEQGSWK